MSDDGQNKGESTNEVEFPPTNTTTQLNTTSITLPSQIKVPNIQETKSASAREINTALSSHGEESVSICKNLSQENNQSSYSDKSNHDQENETKVPTTT